MQQSNTAARTFGPGVYKRLPYAVYDGIQATNSSRLREMAKSPKQYVYRLDTPREGEALTIGQATHTAILEPHRFLAEYSLWDERSESGRVRPRTGKDWEKFKAKEEGNGRRILLADEFTLASAMRDAVRNHGPALRYLRKGDPEISLVWDDLETRRRCKGRVDWVADENALPVLVGVKTARECGPRSFGNSAFKWGYHLQWAFYFDGFFTATGVSPRMVEIVVEKEPPHDVAVYAIPPELIELGREEYRRLLVKLEECEHTHTWPGAVPGEEVLTFPSYAFGSDDDVSTLELEVSQ